MTRPAVRARQGQRRDKAALIARLNGALPLSSPDARAALAEWLSSIEAEPAGKALASLVAKHPALSALLGGLAGGSPYLWDLVRADPARFVQLIKVEPENEVASVLATGRRKAGAARTPE